MTAEKFPEKKVNEFGLPPEWAIETSVAGLEEIRKNGLRVIEGILRKSSEDLKGFGNNDTFASVKDVTTSLPHEIDHLRMSMEDKIAHLNTKFPKGLEISNSGVFVKWEEILPYELWAIRNHSQTLATLNRRVGVILDEASAIRLGVSYRNKVIESLPSDKVVNWLRSNDMLKE